MRLRDLESALSSVDPFDNPKSKQQFRLFINIASLIIVSY